MHLSDASAALSGRFHLEIRDRRGELLDSLDEPNLIVEGAKNQLSRLVAGSGTNRHITHIGFGVGTSAPSPGNTGLSGAYWKSIGSVEYPAAGQVAFSWSLATSEANGLVITEFGLRCADGTLFARKVRNPIHKSDDLSLTGVWTIIF